MSELYKETLASIAKRLASGETTSKEVVTAQLSRIRALNPTLNAFTQVMEEAALASASRADASLQQGNLLGPLHGVPIAIKDLLDIQGTTTSCASRVRQNHVAKDDAYVIERLKSAGAVIVGKLNMTEFALSGYHPEQPVAVNPWGFDRWSGASSSGSAVAAAAGLAYGTIASDTGGSIRLPAAVNGVVGIKPTFGTVSKGGAFPLAYTLDHIGPITRSVEDAAIMLDVIRGYDPNDPFSHEAPKPDLLSDINQGVKGLRIGIDENYTAAESDSDVSEAVQLAGQRFAELGAKLVNVDIMGILDVVRYWSAVVAAEAGVIHADTYPEQADDYGPVFGALLGASDRISGTRVTKARVATARAMQTFNAAFESVDMILCPGAPTAPLTLDEIPPSAIVSPEISTGLSVYTAPMNFTGVPTLSLPGGFSESQLPLGLQLVGRNYSEHLLIQAGHAYEQASDWINRWPTNTP